MLDAYLADGLLDLYDQSIALHKRMSRGDIPILSVVRKR